MAPKTDTAGKPKDTANRWGFFSGIVELLSAFPQATFAQKAGIVAMALFAALFVSLGTFGSLVLPAWAVVTVFIVAALLILVVAGIFLMVGKEAMRCRHVPNYPVADEEIRKEIKESLEEIRSAFADELRNAVAAAGLNLQFPDASIRANIFLLAKVPDGELTDQWRLVMDSDFMINMYTPSERDLKFRVGQGATGISYRDSTYQLTRILPDPKANGRWDKRYQLNDAQLEQIDPNLKWIYSFPLRSSNTNEAVGVLNIDGLQDVASNEILNACASKMIPKINAVAEVFELLPSICIGRDQLGVLQNA